MPHRAPTLLGRALLASVVVLGALPGAGVASGPTAGSGDLTVTSCRETPAGGPVRLDAALDAGVSASEVRGHNDLTREELTHLADDDTTWLDECGRVFVVDEAVPAGQRDAAVATTEEVPADVFDLSSRPGSDRTVFLDFEGSTYVGTRWNDGREIVSPAYSVDADRTTFGDIERAQIHLAWRSVAEDYAPFDVNVTTRRPAPSALTRTSSSDRTYGVPVVITSTNVVGSGCGCGGAAYVGVLGVVGANDYQPAWAFTNGSGTGGLNIGQVVSHEVGHTFGLGHDGTSEVSYYTGARGWAPIMGASYGTRASQWSSGAYPDADNPEDDVAVIADTAPVLADDHAGTATAATPIAPGTTNGLITSRTDVDAFSFTGSGATTVAVTGPAGSSNLDVMLTVLDPRGVRVATVDPVADSAIDGSMSATWTADLPVTAGTWTAVVDGVGSGDPRETGRYDDYGSLGAYTLTLTTTTPAGTPTQTPTPTPTTDAPPPSPTPMPTPTPTTVPAGHPTVPAGPPPATSVQQPAFVTTRLPPARVGRAYRAAIRFTGTVVEARVDRRLPAGLRWRVRGDRILVRGTVRAPTTTYVTASLSGPDSTVRMRLRFAAR
ncbi:M12 family metallo-peptidase [Microvirga sp. 0TCS3.31]